MSLQERFIKNLKRYREELGCSQEQLGNRLGSDRTAISRYERTSSRMTIERADALARALDVDVRVLLETPEDHPIAHRPPGSPISSKLVGQNVRDRRTAQHISQKELGDRVGMDRNHVSRIEASTSSAAALQLATLEKLAVAFGIKPTDLL
ncbi:helix-turn-helix domain-containing protein [Paraburkholderia unamae]|uniref:DNA-binding XRE family transcriptional regulator n=1 Tax=Paraburkholderia unamae TaxID=219649 RepID=A0ABX5KKX5_9BURK|nr:helix-turn-helix transcriptional regulator [Paraburkholderia unamae]PVX82412.1 DNA-binding XRE family transcriptional regulator [Paraburkholderia unamae]